MKGNRQQAGIEEKSECFSDRIRDGLDSFVRATFLPAWINRAVPGMHANFFWQILPAPIRPWSEKFASREFRKVRRRGVCVGAEVHTV